MELKTVYYAKKDNQYYSFLAWGIELTKNISEASCFDSIYELIVWLKVCDVDDYEIVGNEQ